MFRWLRFLLFAILVTVPAFGQSEKQPDKPTSAPPSPTLTAEQWVDLFAAQHKVDLITTQMKDMDTQFQQLQVQVKARYQQLQDDQAKASKDLETTKQAIYKDTAIDPTKFDIDLESRQVKPKPQAARAEPPPIEAAKK